MSFNDVKLSIGRAFKFMSPNLLYVLSVAVAFIVAYFFRDAHSQKFLYSYIGGLVILSTLLTCLADSVVDVREDAAKKSYKVYGNLSSILSDIFMFGGLLVSRITNFYLSAPTFILVILTSTLSVLGKAEADNYAKQGPMCKCCRGLILALAALGQWYGYEKARPFLIFDLEHGRVFSWLDLGASILIVLLVVTIVWRFWAIRKQVLDDTNKEW